MTQIKWIVSGIAALAIAALLAYGGWRLYSSGEAHVQAQWDATKLLQVQASVEQVTKARATEQAQVQAFSSIEQTYIKDSVYEHALAPSVASSVASGTLRVRLCDAQAARPAGSAVFAASAGSGGSHAAPAIAAQNSGKPEAIAVRAIQLGDDADAREQQLREQVMALQAILKAERSGK